MAPSSHISLEEKRGAVLVSEETFPNNLGHLVGRHSGRTFDVFSPSAEVKVRMGPASRIPHQGCRNSVTPDILSFSSLRLIRVMPLFGSARYEHG